MQIANPTTPSQFFHLLRRQAKQPWHKPLVIFTPKGLLRHPACVSQFEELTEGAFQTIIDEAEANADASQIIFCSGRFYYDLMAMKKSEKREDIALIRFEQLYPFDVEKLKQILSKYDKAKKYIWAQEEPLNMGPWTYLNCFLPKLLPQGILLVCISRERSAAPATGYYGRHKQEQAHLIQQVLNA